MSDIPKLPAVQLDKTLRSLVTASQAVRLGIATHTQKHVASRHEQRAKLEAERKLTQQK